MVQKLIVFEELVQMSVFDITVHLLFESLCRCCFFEFLGNMLNGMLVNELQKSRGGFNVHVESFCSAGPAS